MTDLTLAVRKELVKAMRANAALTALVSATRVYGVESPATPVWPFIRYGFPTAVPNRGTCLDGRDVTVAIHAFAKGPGEDAASAIGWAVEQAIDGLHFSLDGYSIDVQVTGAQIIRDTDEASAYHWFCNVRAQVAA
jgi:hypothetical protein